MNTKEEKYETGLLLGIFLIAVPMIADSLDFQTDSTVRSGPREILRIWSIYYFGVLFLLSYYYERKCFLFRWLMWICVNFSHPEEYGRKMAFVYFVLSVLIGTMALWDN
ncbi:MAG: hypothetical protein OCC45_15460 [Desulfotalea sp.]